MSLEKLKKCERCHGKGQLNVVCPSCNGTGKVNKEILTNGFNETNLMYGTETNEEKKEKSKNLLNE